MSDKNELMTTGSGFLALADFNMNESMAEELEGLEGGFDRVKIPSGGATMQNAVPTKIPVTLFLTRLERLYMRAAQPLLLTRCRRATACGPLQKSASETAPGTMRSRN